MPAFDAFTVHMPFPPSVNNLFTQATIAGRVRRFPSKRYKRWTRDAIVACRLLRRQAIADAVSVSVILNPPDFRRRDVDNYLKAILDALVKGGIMADDKQVADIQARWGDGKPGAVVEIRPALSAHASRMRSQMKRDGIRLRNVGEPVPPSVIELCEKGYAEALPGLLDDEPQAHKLLD